MKRIPLTSYDWHNILKLVHKLRFSPEEKEKIFKRRWMTEKQEDTIRLEMKRLAMEDIQKGAQ